MQLGDFFSKCHPKVLKLHLEMTLKCKLCIFDNRKCAISGQKNGKKCANDDQKNQKCENISIYSYKSIDSRGIS